MPIITKTGDINGIYVWLTMQFNMEDDKSAQLLLHVLDIGKYIYTCKFDVSR